MKFSGKTFLSFALLALGGLAIANPASAASVLFDFESTPATWNSTPAARPGALTSLTVTNGGLSLSLTRVDNARFDIVNNIGGQTGKPASWGLHSIDPFFDPTKGFIGNLSAPVGGVSLEFGDYFADSDTLTLNIFSGLNGTGTLLGSTTLSYPSTTGFPTVDTAALSAAGIQSFTIDGTSNVTGFSDSVFLDNFRFEVAAVPEPSTWAMMLIGFAGLGFAGYKQARRGAIVA